MAIIYRCDRCHAENTDRNWLMCVTVPHTSTVVTQSDMCPRCRGYLAEKMAPIPLASDTIVCGKA